MIRKLRIAPQTARQIATYAFFTAACVYVFFFVASFAWVSDDAYITFRVVDNAANGLGLRWNPDERVQVFTHPLWMLLHIPLYMVYHNIFIGTMGLSMVLATIAVIITMRTVPCTPWHKIILILAPLFICRSYRNHIINGLEEPLTLLLMALFWYCMINAPAKLARLWLLASLLLITRLDLAVILGPALVFLCWESRPPRLKFWRYVAATSPLWGWLGFSLFYYGFMFPNTKYAKLNTGFRQSEYTQQGYHYLDNFYDFDRYGYLFIVAAMVCGVYTFACYVGERANKAPAAAPATLSPWIIPMMLLGVALHIVYVVRVGGDFMAGRFFVTPFYVCMTAMYVLLHRVPLWVIGLLGVFNCNLYRIQEQNIHGHRYIPAYAIYDERAYYNGRQGLFIDGGFIDNFFEGNFSSVARLRKIMRFNVIGAKYTSAPTEGVADGTEGNEYTNQLVVSSYIGVWGYIAGPHKITIDTVGLCDPLLARLPATHWRWHIGHFTRQIPTGYQLAHRNGDTSKMQQSLGKYYDKLRLVTSGDLWDPERLQTIIGFNTGQYDVFLRRYIAQMDPRWK